MSDVAGRSSAARLPTGTVTFLFTDIEGSTQLLQRLGTERFDEVISAHNERLRRAFADGGHEVRVEGDALFVVFPSAVKAVAAAAAAQLALAKEGFPHGADVRVRMGLHTGEGTAARLDAAADYVGIDVHRAARIAAAGHGGQVLISIATRSLVEGLLPDGVTLRDLGDHRLKDLERPEHLYQLVVPGLESDFPPLRSLGSGINNLPAQLTSFIGRTQEMQQLLGLLRSSRLVTLTGPGGTGKTRLSLEVAASCLDEFAGGVFFIPLAAISDAELVIPTLASTLGVRDTPARPLRDALIEHLRDRPTLLVLDNFEQLISASPIVGDLLAGAHGLKVLVTSREALRIAGEQEFPLPPLAVPKRGAPGRLDELRRIDSVALFLQRARSVRPDLDLTAGNADAIAAICDRLDGLPLAIELAAARSRLFEPRELLARLENSLSFLAGGRDVPERQRTLRGAIEWSHELLAEPEQILFRRLAVFAGGCTLESVDAVCARAGLELDPVEGVSSLHDKSLLRRDDAAAGALRVSMLQTIREYAWERLRACHEESGIRRLHAGFFEELAKRAGAHIPGPDQDGWLDMLDLELDNYRAALKWAIDMGEPDAGLRTAAALGRFWLFRNHQREGRRYIEELLAMPAGETGSLAARAAALSTAADIAGWQADYAASGPLAQMSLAAYRELGDLPGIAQQLSSLGYAAVTSDPAAALRLFRESIEAFRQAGAPPEMGQALVGMSCVEMQLRDIAAASGHLAEALALFEGAGDASMALIPAGLLGVCARLAGDLSGARRRYVDVLLRAQRSGWQAGVTLPIAGLADLALEEGEAERAALLGGAEAQIAEGLGGTPSFTLMGMADVLERARAALGDETYRSAVARGRAASLDEIVRLALADRPEQADRRSRPRADATS